MAGRRVTRWRLKSCQAGVWARTSESRLITSRRCGWNRRRQRESVDPLCQLAGALWSRQWAAAARSRHPGRRCLSSLRDRGEIQLLNQIQGKLGNRGRDERRTNWGAPNLALGVLTKVRFAGNGQERHTSQEAQTIRTYHRIQLEKRTKTPRVT